MDSYLWLKLLHIIAATIVAGTGSGIAFFMLMAYRSENDETFRIITRLVVIADWIFTTPAVITQFVTGVLLMNILGYSFSSTWFLVVISLFIFIGCCWIPVIFIQIKLSKLVNVKPGGGRDNKKIEQLMRIWTVSGIPAFISVIVIFWLMVFKPLPMF